MYKLNIDKINLVLLKKEMTKADLAKKLKVSRVRIHHLFKGENKAQLNTIWKLSKILDVKVEELILVEKGEK